MMVVFAPFFHFQQLRKQKPFCLSKISIFLDGSHSPLKSVKLYRCI
uniref:Uncharacterized protein n=1 Tax=Utricularia reniformis TaxID=192314 RepID=A0A1Y0B3J0_9LAMI|nr:hypothetical protein AEK19_MT1773 [Utricularia reniformis]ART31947.1 hypothetical protein AEK19_MT1773 [Utricularia reniformis]